MKTPKLKDLVQGKVVDIESQDLRDQITKDAEIKVAICDAMNKFDEPISFTVHQKTGNWEMRNVYFWKMIQQKDEDVLAYLNEVLANAR